MVFMYQKNSITEFRNKISEIPILFECSTSYLLIAQFAHFTLPVIFKGTQHLRSFHLANV